MVDTETVNGQNPPTYSFDLGESWRETNAVSGNALGFAVLYTRTRGGSRKKPTKIHVLFVTAIRIHANRHQHFSESPMMMWKPPTPFTRVCG